MDHSDHTSAPFRFEVTKAYDRRGPLHQFRVARAIAFQCSRCSQSKTSKLVALIRDDWDRLLCNACYGRLLSLWEIKAGDLDDTDRYAELHKQLTEMVTEAEVEQLRVVLKARDQRWEQLSQDALTTLATAEAVAAGLSMNATELDWSAAVIGLCKAIEIEVGRLVSFPLRRAVSGFDLTQDLANGDLRKVAKFCSGRGRPPELGAVVYLLSKVTDSRERASKSALANGLHVLSKEWPNSDWLFAEKGFRKAIKELTWKYRNPAAHTELLGESQYEACNQFVQGSNGILWILIAAVSPRP